VGVASGHASGSSAVADGEAGVTVDIHTGTLPTGTGSGRVPSQSNGENLNLKGDSETPDSASGTAGSASATGQGSQDVPITLAFSGGGIRAGLIATGVLCYLEGAGLADQVDVVSCVSGGGYAGSSYTLWKQAGRTMNECVTCMHATSLRGNVAK
jgi:hypothetical protein